MFHRLQFYEDGRFPVFARCLKILNPDLLYSREIRANPVIQNTCVDELSIRKPLVVSLSQRRDELNLTTWFRIWQFQPRLKSGISKCIFCRKRFVFWGWWSWFSRRESQDHSIGPNVDSLLANFFSVFTSIVYESFCVYRWAVALLVHTFSGYGCRVEGWGVHSRGCFVRRPCVLILNNVLVSHRLGTRETQTSPHMRQGVRERPRWAGTGPLDRLGLRLQEEVLRQGPGFGAVVPVQRLLRPGQLRRPERLPVRDDTQGGPRAASCEEPRQGTRALLPVLRQSLRDWCTSE